MSWLSEAEKKRKEKEKELKGEFDKGVETVTNLVTGKSAPKSNITPMGSQRKSPITLPSSTNTKLPSNLTPKVTPKVTPQQVTPPGWASTSTGSAKINTNPNFKYDLDSLDWAKKDIGTSWDLLSGGDLYRGTKRLSTDKNLAANWGAFSEGYMSQGPMKNVGQQMLGSRGPTERATGQVPTEGPWGKPKEPGAEGFMDPQGIQPGGEGVQSGSIKIPGYSDSAAKGILSGPEAADDGSISRRYQALNANLQASEGSRAAGEQEALNRRFASMGALNSGAALRNSRVQSDSSNRRLMAGQNELAAAESGEKQQAAEMAKTRNLQREQLSLGSEEQRRANELEATKLEIGNTQFGKELALNERISNLNSTIAWQNHQDNKDLLSTLTMGMFSGNTLPGWLGGGKDQNKDNPYYKPVVPV